LVKVVQLPAMSSVESSKAVRKGAACSSHLDAYEACMEDHRGVRPAPYEGEWCEEFRNAYHVCRAGDKPLSGTEIYVPDPRGLTAQRAAKMK
jgi:hypothetical protein